LRYTSEEKKASKKMETRLHWKKILLAGKKRDVRRSENRAWHGLKKNQKGTQKDGLYAENRTSAGKRRGGGWRKPSESAESAEKGAFELTNTKEGNRGAGTGAKEAGKKRKKPKEKSKGGD